MASENEYIFISNLHILNHTKYYHGAISRDDAKIILENQQSPMYSFILHDSLEEKKHAFEITFIYPHREKDESFFSLLPFRPNIGNVKICLRTFVAKYALNVISEFHFWRQDNNTWDINGSRSDLLHFNQLPNMKEIFGELKFEYLINKVKLSHRANELIHFSLPVERISPLSLQELTRSKILDMSCNYDAVDKYSLPKDFKHFLANFCIEDSKLDEIEVNLYEQIKRWKARKIIGTSAKLDELDTRILMPYVHAIC